MHFECDSRFESFAKFQGLPTKSCLTLYLLQTDKLMIMLIGSEVDKDKTQKSSFSGSN